MTRARRPTRWALFAGTALVATGCAARVGPGDAAAADATPGVDTPSPVDAGDETLDDAPADAATPDAEMCGVGPNAMLCSPGQVCLICSVGKRTTFTCVAQCASPADCRDPRTPNCVRGGCNDRQFCSSMTSGCACGICAAADTPIATPVGERVIAEIVAGDVVYGTRDGQLAPVRVLRATRTPVWRHHMIRVSLRGGRVVEMSPGHPSIDGERFDALAAGDALGFVPIERTERVPYAGTHTYDLLTDGDRGAYVAAGVLVGSTLWGAGAACGDER